MNKTAKVTLKVGGIGLLLIMGLGMLTPFPWLVVVGVLVEIDAANFPPIHESPRAIPDDKFSHDDLVRCLKDNDPTSTSELATDDGVYQVGGWFPDKRRDAVATCMKLKNQHVYSDSLQL
jgi:hypothetical protein